MHAYEARFGSTLCHVEVKAEPVHGGSMYFATPYLLNDRRDLLHWVPNTDGRPAVIPGGAEQDELARVAAFLTRYLGPQAEPFHPVLERQALFSARRLRFH